MIAAFGELTFFVALAALALPAVVLGLTGRNLKYYGLFATVAMLGITLAGSLKQLALLGAFLVGETVLMKLHLWFITTHGNKNAWERRAAVVLALLPLILVKVTGLFHFPSLGFIGVSYLTFRAVQVIIEISDKLIKSQSVLDHLYFVAFFPTVSSGPIDRSRRFLQDAERRFKPGEYLAILGRGLWLIVLGAFYKFALATLFAGWLRDLPDSRWGTVRYMYYYGFNLFFDFAGYSLMAVGASYLFGIRTPQNFRLPFLSESIKDFWNRWHITLSFWLRDYVYTRLLMAFMRRKVFKDKVRASHVALLVNMTLMGIWHGSEWFYIVYGVYHGVLLVLNDIYERKSGFYKKHHKKLWYRLLGIAATFHMAMFGFLLFSGHFAH